MFKYFPIIISNFKELEVLFWFSRHNAIVISFLLYLHFIRTINTKKKNNTKKQKTKKKPNKQKTMLSFCICVIALQKVIPTLFAIFNINILEYSTSNTSENFLSFRTTSSLSYMHKSTLSLYRYTR